METYSVECKESCSSPKPIRTVLTQVLGLRRRVDAQDVVAGN